MEAVRSPLRLAPAGANVGHRAYAGGAAAAASKPVSAAALLVSPSGDTPVMEARVKLVRGGAGAPATAKAPAAPASAAGMENGASAASGLPTRTPIVNRLRSRKV
jgi:hypothetical protein